MEKFKKNKGLRAIDIRKRFFQFRENNALRSKPSPAGSLKNESGFVLIVILAMAPIIILAMLSILSTMWFVREKEKMQMTCEKHVLIAQQILIDGASDLIDLNPEVDNLVMRKEQLEWELTMAQGPEKMGIAAQLMIVRGQMFLLRVRQRLMMRKAEASAYAELQKIQLATHRQVQNITRLWQKGSLGARVRFRRPRMQVDAHYETGSSLPTYDFGLGYQMRQMINVDIAVHGTSPLPHWFTKLLHRRSINWKEKCTSQPKQEGGRTWRSYLAAVRLL